MLVLVDGLFAGSRLLHNPGDPDNGLGDYAQGQIAGIPGRPGRCISGGGSSFP